jgi:hypothetical protein
MATKTTEPENIHQGATTTWQRTLTDYSGADGYSLKYELVNADGQITFTSDASTTNTHTVSLTASGTANYLPGEYNYHLFAVKTGEKHFIQSGVFLIVANFAGLAEYDARSLLKKRLENLDKAIFRLSNQIVKSYSIDGVNYNHADLNDLLEARARTVDQLRHEEDRARVAAGLGRRSRYQIRFQ